MVKKKFYSWNDVEKMCVSIVNQMYKDEWYPDYIVGITRGGNIPATIISNMTGIRCEALKVSLRDNDQGPESNLWMAEDAFGYVYEDKTVTVDEDDIEGLMEGASKLLEQGDDFKNILIVDDINDTGATFNWIIDDWQSGCFPNDPQWQHVWGNNVRFAVLTDNLSSEFQRCVNYCCDTVNKAEEDVWLVYPWENVGTYA